MSDILSQNEIDALLNALNTGEVDAEEIKESKTERNIKNMILKVLKNWQRIS